MKRVIIAIFSIIYTVLAGYAQTGLELRAPNVVTPGEMFRIEFVLTNAQCEKFIPPTITGADDIVGSPMESRGTYISVENGKRVQLSMVTFTYTLQVTSSSRVSISSASAIAPGGKTYKSQATQIQVTSGGASSGAVPGSTPSSVTRETVFLKMETNKSNVYKGEAVVATLRLYAQVRVLGFEDAKLPAFNGFWQQELNSTAAKPQRMSVNNKVYDSQILKQWLVYPQKSGTVEIEQADVTALVAIESKSTGTSNFDLFFGGSSMAQTVKRKLTTAPIRLNVKELPQPAPDNYTGGVGRFTMEASVSAPEVMANSGGSIIVTMSGAGDFPLVDEPTVELPSGFEKFDSKKSEQIINTADGSSGSRTWEFPFIARAEGEYTIPAVKISYFNPATGKYVSLSSADFKIKVTKDTNQGSGIAGMVSGVTKEDLKMLNQDIHYINTGDLRLNKRNAQFLWSVGFIATFIALILAFVGALVVLKKHITNRADIVRTKNKKANSVALRRLKKAKEYMTANNRSGFYEEILRALWGYMGDKLAISVSDLSKERLREEFAKRDVSTQNAEEFLTLISDCEMAQYSPVTTTNMDQAYNAALDLIGRLELK